jgi:hypothetical protein
MSDHFPPLLPPHESPPVRSLDDLDRHWRAVKGPWGFSGPQLFCQLLGADGQLLPQLINIEDCPQVPDQLSFDNLFGILAEMDEGGSCAAMFARPGDGQLRASDRLRARGLIAAGTAAPIDVWPAFLATDTRVRIVGPDDLAA